ncbi:MAG: pentapeptide repeat-containing protein, partial [Planctomycetales bacterium]
ILVSGKSGSGRTTAISHLAAVLPKKPHIRFADHADVLPGEIDQASSRNLLLITSVDDSNGARRSGRHLLAEYFLAGWSFDDVIEYLLDRWPDRCASVVARLKAADEELGGESHSLEGCPAVWRAALDRMAQDETVTSAVDAVLDEIAELAGSSECLSALQDFCLIAATKQHHPSVGPEIGKQRNQIIRLAAPRGIILRLAADGVIATLTGSGNPELPHSPLPAPVVKQVGIRVDDFAVCRLKSILDDPQLEMFHASAAGILLAAEPRWRPENHAKLTLVHAVLDGAEWDGIELPSVLLSSVSLMRASLVGSELMVAKLDFANFQSADLRDANLTGVDAVQANFSEADLCGVVAQSAYFTFVTFEGAKLDEARLDHAMFRGANLKNASFREACLLDADFKEAVVDGADFRDAVLDTADFDDVALGRANLHGASFYGSSLQRCNLEFIEPGLGADFRAARLMEAHLTGAQLPNARMANADLRSTGLADINLEGADLRGALLDNGTFHMGSSRSGLVDSPLASEGTRTGFYTDEYEEQHYRDPEEVRKANLRGADLRGASVQNTEFYLVDLRGALYSPDQRRHFERCGAILD